MRWVKLRFNPNTNKVISELLSVTIRKQIRIEKIATDEISMTENWSQTAIMICKLHRTDEKQ